MWGSLLGQPYWPDLSGNRVWDQLREPVFRQGQAREEEKCGMAVPPTLAGTDADLTDSHMTAHPPIYS